MTSRTKIRLVSLVLVILVAGSAFAQAKPKAVRLSWETFSKDPKRVAAFRKAVATMKSRSTASQTTATYRTSWTYWANIHGYFGPQSPDGTVAQYREETGTDDPSYDWAYAGVVDVNPPDALATSIWSTCQHGTPWFYSWHRLYLYYFEQVLQVAAGDATLRLPYWDYTNTLYLGMPPEFTTPTYVNESGATVPNPLYEPRRAPGWNVPLTTPTAATLNPLATNINDTLKIKSYFPYQSAIEQTPHGYVHCAVMGCPVTVMGAVPYSSNDPIFWLHHCNIDRTWDCWTSITGNKNPTQASFNNKSWSFVNYRGNKVTQQVKVLFNGTFIDYVYEQPSNCARPTTAPAGRETAETMTPAQVKSAKAAVAKPVVLGTKKSIKISDEVTSHRIAVSGTGAPRDLAMRESAQVPVTTELVLSGIHFEEHPGTQFNVFLARKDDPSRRAFVGTLSFFTAPRHAHHTPRSQTFDVTEELHDLGLSGDAQNEIDVVFEATTGREGATEAAKLNDNANLVVDDIRLQVKSQ